MKLCECAVLFEANLTVAVGCVPVASIFMLFFVELYTAPLVSIVAIQKTMISMILADICMYVCYGVGRISVYQDFILSTAL